MRAPTYLGRASEPLPGPFGRHRRLRANIRLVARLIGQCATLTIHSAVFDTGSDPGYFPGRAAARYGAQSMRTDSPDGLIRIRRYPLTWAKRFAQHLRGFRRLFAPELRFTAFSGDRISCVLLATGSMCCRIAPRYPAEKVVVLPSLVRARVPHGTSAVHGGRSTAGGSWVDAARRRACSEVTRSGLACPPGHHGRAYKQHPKDPRPWWTSQGMSLSKAKGPWSL